MKLYYAPGACSIGIHILLEEIGRPYQTVAVNLREGEQFKQEFTKVNPKAKVPALIRDDDSILTEWPAIAFWLARSNPAAHLMPDDLEGQARMIEALGYIIATIHMQGFSRLFRPGNFTPTKADEEKVKATGRAIVDKGLALMAQGLAGKEWIAGPYSIADAALFYEEFWCAKRLDIPLPQSVAAHYARIAKRPATGKVLAQEGFAN